MTRQDRDIPPAQDMALMPARRPLAMPAQDFDHAFRDPAAPVTVRPSGATYGWRTLAFAPALASAGTLMWIMKGWFEQGTFTPLELVLWLLIGFNFFWISFTVSTVILGLIGLGKHARTPDCDLKSAAEPIDVAVLVPVHNEVPTDVLGNAQSMAEDLHAAGGHHRYSIFILSDTRDAEIAKAERLHVETLRAVLPPTVPIHYRRRTDNTGRKAGNVAEWVRNWGGDFEAMLVLDADSLMAADAIRQLTDALSHDPTAGLIQTYPQLVGAKSIFGRMQQFANGVYGLAMAKGLAMWVGDTSNYWGHNAIIRTRAFAACAGLPDLKPRLGRKQHLIMSHDFVEAGLIRRAGWAVRFLPHIRGSYEETPQTLIDHVLRDRRWCQGNLQHLNLLGTRGLATVSRFHLLHGAVGYLMAPIWFALLVLWALIGRTPEDSVIRYFSEANPMRPSWPDMSEPSHVAVIVLIYAMLLAPKLLALAAIPLTGARFSEFGGGMRFALSMLVEVLLAILFAPILMVQQMIAVLRSLAGLQKGWAPQARDGGSYGWKSVLFCHAIEFASGLALALGLWAGVISFWLAPIALSLVLAPVLSRFSGVQLSRRAHRLMATREVLREPRISRAARRCRAFLRSSLEQRGLPRTPAE